VATPTRRDDPPSAAGPDDLPADVVARLNAVPCFSGLSWHAVELGGGLTNRNYQVSTDAGVFVARLSNPTGSLLAIDRENEYRSSLAAATTGVAPRVVDYAPQAGVLVIEWVQGRTYSEHDLRDSATLPKVAQALRTLHAGPRFPSDFDMFDIRRRYLDVVHERGFRLPPRYLEFDDVTRQIHAALAARDVGTVPCNNDLLAANLIDDGDKVWLIDYEYAGNNDACFEIGNLWSESDLAPELLEELVELYFGRPLRHKVARARLLGLMSKYGWTLWASIQDGVSALDFDFWSWGMEKYDRAVAEFDGPDLPRWMEEAQRED
jgi:thiamine kinase-like enzyme